MIYQLGTKASSSAVLRAVFLLTSGHSHSDLCGCLLAFTSLATCTVEDEPFWSDTALMLYIVAVDSAADRGSSGCDFPSRLLVSPKNLPCKKLIKASE